MDRLDTIRLFTRVIERGSFSAAAREAGIGQSAASKQIAALESHLGAQLLLRTSRRLRPTETGQAFYDSAIRLLEDYAALQSLAGEAQSPSGLIRLSVAPVFGRLYLVPRLPEFLTRHPNISVEMHASSRQANFVEDGIDLAIRHGPLADSAMTARKLTSSPVLTVATPTYLACFGTPATQADLSAHACLAFTGQEEIRPWTFKTQSGAITHHPNGRFRANDGEQIRTALLAHLGIAQVPAWLILPELKSGALHAILRDYETDPLPISAVYPSSRGLTAKLRLFLDFIEPIVKQDLPVFFPLPKRQVTQ